MEKTFDNASITLNNGTKIPLCGLGCFNLNNTSQVVYEAIKNGIRLFDTAKFYKNEKEIGEGIAKALSEKIVKREELYIVTKIWMTDFEKVEETIKGQLKQLQVDYVDLYLLHWPLRVFDTEKQEFQKIPMYKLWANMEDLVDKGYTKSIGVSNFNVQLLLDMLTYCRIKPAINEVEVHPYFQNKGLIHFCQKFGIQIIAFNSFVQGIYAEKHKQSNKKFDLLKEQVIIDLAKQYNKSEGQIALNWAISQNIVVIPKSNSQTRILENYQSVNFRLKKEDYEKIALLEEGLRFCVDVQDWEELGKINIFA